MPRTDTLCHMVDIHMTHANFGLRQIKFTLLTIVVDVVVQFDGNVMPLQIGTQ